MASTQTRIPLAAIQRRPGGAALPAAVAAALLAALFVLLAGAPVAWLWLSICALATMPVFIWFAVKGRALEPLPLLAASGALLFVARPLQLMLDWRDLYSPFAPRDPVQGLSLLDGQEIALYVGQRLDEPLETAMARALGVCALFLVVMLLGYRLGVGERIGRRLSSLRAGTGPINLPVAIGGSLVIGLIAQVVIIARAGGPAGSLESASSQTALSESFVLFLLAGFAFAGVILWVAARRPQSGLEWTGMTLSIMAVCGFSVLAGSRTRVFDTLLALAIIVHYTRRRWRPVELVAGVLLVLAFASAFVVFRADANRHSLGHAAGVARHHLLDGQVILNDLTAFDDVFYATTIYGRSRPHLHGRFLANSALAYVPRKIYPSKPPPGDIAFRRAVWGNQQGAGRPPTAAGDFYIDFGFVGVAVGAALIGVALRAMLGLLRGGVPGRWYRVAVYSILLVVLYEFVTGTFSIAFGFALTLLLPFLLAVHGLGRLPTPALPGSGSSDR